MNAKAMLFINNGECEVLVFRLVLKQGVRADSDLGPSFDQGV